MIPEIIGVTRDGVEVLSPATRSRNFTTEELRQAVADAKASVRGMTWSHDMSTAPLGKLVATERKGKGDEPIVSHVFVPDVLWAATKCGKVLRSYWIESESRWAGLATGEHPVAWQPYVVPAYPDKELTRPAVQAVSGGEPSVPSLDDGGAKMEAMPVAPGRDVGTKPTPHDAQSVQAANQFNVPIIDGVGGGI